MKRESSGRLAAGIIVLAGMLGDADGAWGQPVPRDLPVGGIRINLPGAPPPAAADVFLKNATGRFVNDVVVVVDGPQGQEVVSITGGAFHNNDVGTTERPTEITFDGARARLRLFGNDVFIDNQVFHLFLDFAGGVPAGDYTLEIAPTFYGRVLLKATDLNDPNQTEYTVDIPTGGDGGETRITNRTPYILDELTFRVPDGAILDPASVFAGPFPQAEIFWNSFRVSGYEVQRDESFAIGAKWDLVSPSPPNNATASFRVKYRQPAPEPEPPLVRILAILGIIVVTALLGAAILALAERRRTALVLVILALAVVLVALVLLVVLGVPASAENALA